MTGDVYLQMLQNWLKDELIANEHDDFIYQQDNAPPYWKLTMRAYLNDNLPRRWIGCAGGEDNVMLKQPPRLPDLTSCDFSLGICEELGLCPPSFCKCKRAQTKNHYRTEDSYPRYAASCLGGAGLPI